MNAHLPPPERVLPTLNADGSRNRIRPKLSKGRYYRARLVVGWALIVLFVAAPLIKLNGKPLILLDVPSREFTLIGRTFLATDGFLLMLLVLAIFVGIFWISALLGRAWCGWACPQTVYMELVYRPIERLLEGSRARQMKLDAQGVAPRRLLKHVVFAGISFVLANVFLAYFVSADVLFRWMQQSPIQHPEPFLVMAATTGLMMFDFGYFREQMCTVVCPYARLQAVLLDKRSLIVGYDAKRGEPRTKGKTKEGSGDCIGCNACVVTCPTGIDIRDGLQLDCIACAQCVDACDSIMDKVGKPRGLVKYGSQQVLETGKPASLVRTRIILYTVALAALVTLFTVLSLRQGTADVTVLRGIGAPFVLQGDRVQNQIRVKVENRTGTEKSYQIEILGLDGAQVIAPENPLVVAPGTNRQTSIFVMLPRQAFGAGTLPIQIRVSDGQRFDRKTPYVLLGPAAGSGAPR